MLTRIKPLGWAFGEILSSSDMTALDAQIPFAVDSRGGTYANVAPIVLQGNVQIDALFRSDSQSPWPAYSRLSNGDHSIIPRQIINVYDLVDLTTVHNLVLSRSGPLDGNIQIFHGISGAFGAPIFDNSTGTQIAVAIQDGMVITQYRETPSPHYTAIYTTAT